MYYIFNIASIFLYASLLNNGLRKKDGKNVNLKRNFTYY